jgi:hypothetical protein
MTKNQIIVLFTFFASIILTAYLYSTNVEKKSAETDCEGKYIRYTQAGHDAEGALIVKVFIPRCLPEAEKYGLYDHRGDLLPTLPSQDNDNFILIAKFAGGIAPSCYAMTPEGAKNWKYNASHF